jgi:hypothetical protein
MSITKMSTSTATLEATAVRPRLTPVIAYLDANAVEDIESLRSGVDASMVEALRSAVKDDRLAIPLSDAVALELMASGSRDPSRAAALGREYYALASERVAFKPTRLVVRGAIMERLGGPTLDPFVTRTLGERNRVRARLLGEEPQRVTEIVDDERHEIQKWLDSLRQYAAQARAESAESLKGLSISDLVADLWSKDVAFVWARSRADNAGLLERATEAGITDADLLDIPTIGAVVGVMLGFAVAHAKGRDPRFGDYRDSQHCMLAASAGAIFVTHDGRLTEIANAIPRRPVTVMTLDALVGRL